MSVKGVGFGMCSPRSRMFESTLAGRGSEKSSFKEFVIMPFQITRWTKTQPTLKLTPKRMTSIRGMTNELRPISVKKLKMAVKKSEAKDCKKSMISVWNTVHLPSLFLCVKIWVQDFILRDDHSKILWNCSRINFCFSNILIQNNGFRFSSAVFDDQLSKIIQNSSHFLFRHRGKSLNAQDNLFGFFSHFCLIKLPPVSIGCRPLPCHPHKRLLRF